MNEAFKLGDRVVWAGFHGRISTVTKDGDLRVIYDDGKKGIFRAPFFDKSLKRETVDAKVEK
jgi:preprotein translocase subunit YajC